jgi:hypothetical protein
MGRATKSNRSVCAANDNSPGASCAEPPPAPYPSISPLQLEVLGPLIRALAHLAANDLDDRCEAWPTQRDPVAPAANSSDQQTSQNLKDQRNA